MVALISAQAKQRVLGLIEEGKQQGAVCELDGSQCEVEGFPEGNWVESNLIQWRHHRDVDLYPRNLRTCFGVY